ncbi:hypothetical protein ACPCSP_25680 [Streptomyces cinereoruber]|uniref:hypothetical protein n=1 Tax=Streptomyces cinereoruber TaxID=67260 RepID=UPI003C306981
MSAAPGADELQIRTLLLDLGLDWNPLGAPAAEDDQADDETGQTRGRLAARLSRLLHRSTR